MNFVLDASVTMAWCFEDESSLETDQILDSLSSGASAYVPMIWHLEVINALCICERRKRITESETGNFLNLLATLPIIFDNAAGQSMAILGLSRQHNLSAYDSAYLELAMRIGIPLASRDAALRKAAGKAGLSVSP
jgi:predicted nucleic acid-binding protein